MSCHEVTESNRLYKAIKYRDRNTNTGEDVTSLSIWKLLNWVVLFYEMEIFLLLCNVLSDILTVCLATNIPGLR